MEKAYVVGIDMGGTNTPFGIVDHAGNIISEGSVPTNKHSEIEKYIDDLYEGLMPLIHKAGGVENIQGIGIGAPNGNFYKGTIEFAPNLPWKGVIHLAQLISDKFGIPAVLTNDANAAAIGEMIYGNAKGEKDFIMITLGTGVGSGIVANGELIYGHDGFAGEVGHTIYNPEGRQCGCGRKGCLETYASAGGIVKTAIEMLENSDKESILKNFKREDLSARTIGMAAQEGDELAIEVFDYTAKILGLKLADSVAHTSPSSIYIFGGVANAGDVLMKPLKKHFEDALLAIFKNKINIRLSGLNARNAAILGAAALIKKA